MPDEHPRSDTSTIPTRNRELWLDVAKGISIVSVVLFHSGTLSSEGTIARRAWEIVDLGLFTFIMPLFFLVSGLVMGSSLALPFVSFLKRRVWPITYLFVLWGSIYAAFDWFSDGAVGSTVLATITLQSVLWYLAALAAYMAIAWLTRNTATTVVLIVAALVAVPSAIFFPFDGWGLAHGPHFLVFFLAGCRLSGQIASRIKGAGFREVLVLVALTAALAGAAYLIPDARSSVYALAPLVSVPIVLLLSQVITRWPSAAGVVAKVGVASLAIFVVHGLILGLIRPLLDGLPSTPVVPWLAPLAGTVIALAISMALWAFRGTLAWLFKPPSLPVRPSPGTFQGMS